jgi:hypothetical protein
MTGAGRPDGNGEHRRLGVAATYPVQAKNIEIATGAASDQHHRDRIERRIWFDLNLITHQVL